MISKNDIASLLGKYIDYFPEEKSALGEFIGFIEKFNIESYYDRKNFTGHVTVSALVTDHSCERFLLLAHKQLQKWLQPGGHVEAQDTSLLAGAMREVEEETGFTPDQYDIMCTDDGMCLIDVDSHHIPPSERKSEAEHYHHDIRFLFRLKTEDLHVKIEESESTDYKWVTRAEFPDYFGTDRPMRKLPLFNRVLNADNL